MWKQLVALDERYNHLASLFLYGSQIVGSVFTGWMKEMKQIVKISYFLFRTLERVLVFPTNLFLFLRDLVLARKINFC